MLNNSGSILRLIAMIISLVSSTAFCAGMEKNVDDEKILQLLDGKEYEKATVEIEKAFQIEPECAVCYFARGYILEQQGRQSQAMQNYNEAIERSPDYSPFYYFRGKLHMSSGIFQMGSYRKETFKRCLRLAIVDFTKGILLQPGNIELFYRERGDAYSYLGDYPKALSDYQKFMSSGNNDAFVLCDIGKCHLALNHPDKALKFLLDAVSEQTISDLCIVDIALAYTLKNEKEKAAYYLEMAVGRKEFVAEYGLDESDPRWDNIRETAIFRKINHDRKLK